MLDTPGVDAGMRMEIATLCVPEPPGGVAGRLGSDEPLPLQAESPAHNSKTNDKCRNICLIMRGSFVTCLGSFA